MNLETQVALFGQINRDVCNLSTPRSIRQRKRLRLYLKSENRKVKDVKSGFG